MEATKAGEIRRVNVVYFLSRSGRVEHPHLIRTHLLHRNGVHLRDVKRWLAEIRGKEMPNSFAWSYKRKYRNGYVWQDLTDDDLITPISDNEYVLKGSELVVNPSISTLTKQHFVSLENSQLRSKEDEKDAVNSPKSAADTFDISPDDDDDDTDSPKSPPAPSPMQQHDEESSCPSDVSARRKAIFKIDASRAEKEKTKAEVQKRGPASLLTGGKEDGGNYSKKATEALWNILTCREAGTIDGALRPASRRGYGSSSGDAVGSSTRSGGSSDNSRKERAKSGGKGSRKAGENGVHPAAHKPSASPFCSQCGKAFKPEKLHSHMISCKALKRKGKDRMNNEKTSYRVNPKPRNEGLTKQAPTIYLTQ